MTIRSRPRNHKRRTCTWALNRVLIRDQRSHRREACLRRYLAVPPSRSTGSKRVHPLCLQPWPLPPNRWTRMGLVHPLCIDLPTKSGRVPPGPTRRMRCPHQVPEVVTQASGAPRASPRTVPAVTSAAVFPSRLPAHIRSCHITGTPTTRGPKGGTIESSDQERKGPLN